MRNNIQRSIYSHILGNIMSLVRKKGCWLVVEPPHHPSPGNTVCTQIVRHLEELGHSRYLRFTYRPHCRQPTAGATRYTAGATSSEPEPTVFRRCNNP